MISHKHKYIFIHIPKCAGSSIERILLRHEHVTCNWNHRFPLQTLSPEDKNEYKLDINSQQHAPLNDFSEVTQQKYFCFTVVRNPWDKLVSSWLYHKKNKQYQHSLKHFITSKNIGYKKTCVEPYHLNTQCSFINKNMDAVYRFEHINQDFKLLQEKLKIGAQLPHNNKTQHKHYTEYYDEETREIVARRYVEDIECFGYEYG